MQSLFDRISEPGRDDLIGAKDRFAVEIASIERELNYLLNTRSYLSGKAVNAQRTILDYGVENIVSAGTTVSGKLENVILNVRKAIENYEPRLNKVRVTGEYITNSPTQVLLRVNANLAKSNEAIQYKIPLELPSNDV